MMETAIVKTPLGPVRIEGDNHGIRAITVTDSPVIPTDPIPQLLETVVDQLRAYFAGTLREFDLKLNPKGTEFQQRVWAALLDIPYGNTTSYLQLATGLGDPKAIRAVAAANGKNPLWIVVPCHRVIGRNGDLVGYAGGLARKKWLLDHESPVKQLTIFS